MQQTKLAVHQFLRVCIFLLYHHVYVLKAYLSSCYNELHVLCTVLFRIIGVSQDLTPAYTGSMTIYVRVSTTVQTSSVTVVAV